MTKSTKKHEGTDVSIPLGLLIGFGIIILLLKTGWFDAVVEWLSKPW